MVPRTVDMTSRDDIVIEITPQVLLKAYACGIFPMAESADDPALYWIEPQQRGILPLDEIHVPRRLARTIRQGVFDIRIDSGFRRRHLRLRGLAPGTAHDLDQSKNPQPLPRAVQLRPLPHGRGMGRAAGSSAASTAWRSTAPSSARACSRSRATPARSRSSTSCARLIRGGFSLLDTQFVTEHLKQFGAVEIDRAEFHKLLEKALATRGGFLGSAEGRDPRRHPRDADVARLISAARDDGAAGHLRAAVAAPCSAQAPSREPAEDPSPPGRAAAASRLSATRRTPGAAAD